MVVRFANGEEHSCPMFSVLEQAGLAYIFVDDMTFVDAAVLFSDKEKTKAITYNGETYYGYTGVAYVMNMGNAIKANLYLEDSKNA